MVKVQTIRVSEDTNMQLKRFKNFLSDRSNGKSYSQEKALLHLLNYLDQSDLDEYNQWLYGDLVQTKTREELKEELRKERMLGEAVMSVLCASCQRHTAEIIEGME